MKQESTPSVPTYVTAGALALLVCFGMGLATEDHEVARRLRNAGVIVPLVVVRRAARQVIPGRILDVEFQADAGRLRYLLELLDAHGVVWYLRYDARTGTLLHIRKDKGR